MGIPIGSSACLTCLSSLFALLVSGSLGLVPLKVHRFRRRQHIQGKGTNHPQLYSKNNGNDDDDVGAEEVQLQARDIYVVPWDGCLVDQTPRKIETGLKAAFHVWPELDLLTRDADLQWLFNKLHALKHVLAPPVKHDFKYDSAVEFAMAIRILLEEQELDEGRSNGSRGKYGSKFHPSADDPAFAGFDSKSGSDVYPRRRRRQRPLTVGEISTNWKESLREAAWIRYFREEGENPLDLLQEAILLEDQEETSRQMPLPEMTDPQLVNMLNGKNSNAFVVGVYHESDLSLAKASLLQAGCGEKPLVECQRVTQVVTEIERGNIPLFCFGADEVTYEDFLYAAPAQSTIHILESYWSRLQDLIIPLYGDHIPRLHRRHVDNDGTTSCCLIGKCVVPDRLLQLRLCEWASHPNDQSSATMNAWTTTLTVQQWAQELHASVSDTVQQRTV